jgi:hypothetical protein
MKKFGTPSGAGPGRANENVGFDGPGTPGPVIPVGADLLFLVARFDFAFFTCLVTFEAVVLMSCPTELLGFLKDEGVVVVVV